ncbi:unnamed protein product [Kluyveromyces dobzhanskii CBS 2104]|uniref:WGS project CCBQ000000000 data, contig 00008 n=1 Tax=Kluyveromyces dobzhanskii CBS 2104 TaxID=1427455 RepID=A0A0A8L9W3_9SACH|nr:unnamed protein product [Kluyveromyces dobzhanskii CBS 2104]
MNVRTEKDAELGPTAGMAFGNGLVKPEQELLQKQQLYQSSGYPHISQPLLSQQQQQHAMGQPMYYSASGSTPSQQAAQPAAQPAVQPPHTYVYNQSGNVGGFGSNYSFGSSVGSSGTGGGTTANGGASSNTGPKTDSSSLSSYTLSNSGSSLNPNGHESSPLLMMRSNTSGTPQLQQQYQQQYQNPYQQQYQNQYQNQYQQQYQQLQQLQQQKPFSLPQLSHMNQHFAPGATASYQYGNLQQAYQPAAPMNSVESSRQMQHYQQLHNLQQLQLQQVKLQTQTQTLSHHHHHHHHNHNHSHNPQYLHQNNPQLQSSTALQPSAPRTAEESLRNSSNHLAHETQRQQPQSQPQLQQLQQLQQQQQPQQQYSQDHDNENDNESNGDMSQDSHHIYQCNMCEKQFRRKSWLKRHLLSHSNVKKFHCPWCSSTHKRKDNLLQHLKLKHTQYLLHEFTLFGILLNVNNGSGNTANLVTTDTGEKVWLINNEPSITIRDMLDSNTLPKDQVKRCLNYIVDTKCK